MFSVAINSLSFNGAVPVPTVQRAVAPLMQEAVAVPEPPPPPPKIQTLRVGDKALAGDFGFDPLGLADEPKKLAWYREAEVKHARLAMLAAAGWPLSEKLNLNPDLLVNGRAPSLLNGGLGNINTLYWAAALGLAFGASLRVRLVCAGPPSVS